MQSIRLRCRGLCRMCGERYAGESINIFEPQGSRPPYSELLRELMGMRAVQGDCESDRIGLTCANLLNEWSSFRARCTVTQSYLLKKLSEMQKAEVTGGASGNESGEIATNESMPSTSKDGASTCEPGPSGLNSNLSSNRKRPRDSSDDDSDDSDSATPSKKPVNNVSDSSNSN